MCTRIVYGRESAKNRQRRFPLDSPVRQLGFAAGKLVVLTVIVLTLSTVGFWAYHKGVLGTQRFSALDHELNLAMELMRRDISQDPAPVIVNKEYDCIIFEFDRNRDGIIDADEIGAYRHEMVGGIGVLALWMGEGVPDCADPDPWTPVSDASVIDIKAFTVAADERAAGFISAFQASFRNAPAPGQIYLKLQGHLVNDADAARAVKAAVEVENSTLL